jgi:hypothetical protein
MAFKAFNAIGADATTSVRRAYLPAAQLSHAAPLVVAYVSAAQMVQTEAPAATYSPAAQAKQVLWPALEYVPAAQEMQVLWPALEYVPAAQEMQVSAVVAPSCEEYVPAAQSWQAVAPDCAESSDWRRMRIWLGQAATWYSFLPLLYNILEPQFRFKAQLELELDDLIESP